MTRRRGRFATIPPPPQEGLTERELAFYTAVKQNLEMLTGTRSAETLALQDSTRLDRIETLNRNRSGTGIDPIGGDAPTPFEQRLIDLNERLEQLRNVTLPELEETLRLLNEVTLPELERDLANLNEVQLPNLEQDLDELNNVTLPALQDDLDDLNDDLDTLNNTTLPTLQQELDDILPITETKIENDSISAPKLKANSVIAGKIAANAIAANEIASDTITGNMIKADTITAFNIFGDTITANEIASGTITANEIATGTITALQISGNTITANEIAGGTITATEIAGSTITSNEIATGTIKALNIEAGTITGTEINGTQLSSIFTDTGTLTANLIRTEQSPNLRLEITNPGTDGTYAIWGGDGSSKGETGRFWVKHNGDAKFGGRVFSSQLQGPIMDAVPFDLTSSTATDNTSTVNWVTVGDRFLEFPETIDRPRRGFISAKVPVFTTPGGTSQGAWIRVQAQIQNSNGTWPATWTTIVQEYTVNTDPIGSAAPIAAGTATTGEKGFRFRVQFKALSAGQSPRTNRYSGIFLGLPTITGFNVKVDSTGNAASGGTSPGSGNLLIPPDFGDGWIVP